MAGVVVGSGLLLAFTLKEDKFDAKFPLTKRAPASSPSNITSNSTHYVVVTQISQPVTCFSSLNVGGNSFFLIKLHVIHHYMLVGIVGF